MKIEIEMASTVIIPAADGSQETFTAGMVLDIEESIGEQLVKGRSARLVIEYRPDALNA